MSELASNALGPANGSRQAAEPLPASALDILDEARFQRMLCLERKRTERSGRRFVLMLLECAPLLKAGGDRKLVANVQRALSNSIRETDIRGWYKEGWTLGVIFTEVAEEGQAVSQAILSRVMGALSSALRIEEINEIRISFHIFPEDHGGSGHNRESDPRLYPDLDPEAGRRRADRFLKRSMDIAGSLLLLAALSPLLAVIALAVKLTSRGPVLFRQQRVGQFGRRFTFLKFRSMHPKNDASVHREYVKSLIAGGDGCDQSGGNGRTAVYKLTNDKRVTPVGRILRRTSLDELPQLINVLRGDMSLVGPRPAIPYEVEAYNIWHRRRVLAVKPGITGLWQVSGRSRVKFDDMVRLDLRYASSWSLWLDLKILLLTPRAVLSGDGAY